MGDLAGSLRWSRLHDELAATALLAGAAHPEVRRIVRAGDEVEVEGGATLLREDTIGYWMFIVLEGSLRRSRDGLATGRIGAGGHTGEIAIVGFGPQPETVVAETAARLFVLGRRDVLNLAGTSGPIQCGLFPQIAPGEVDAHVRDLRAKGQLAWKSVPRAVALANAKETLPSTFRPVARSRALTSPFGFLSVRPSSVGEALARVPVATPAWVRPTVAAVALVACLAFVLVYHPPVLVVGPAEPIDVAAGIKIDGRDAPVPRGRYLLTAVRIDQPNLLGAALAKVGHRRTLHAAPDQRGENAAAREAFAESRRAAVAMAAKQAGRDPDSIDVSFPPSDIVGASGGLVYALAVADALDERDLARGRTIAATGSLGPDGRIGGVYFVDVKREVARHASADLFLVPPATIDAGDHVVVVRTLDEAIATLLRHA